MRPWINWTSIAKLSTSELSGQQSCGSLWRTTTRNHEQVFVKKWLRSSSCRHRQRLQRSWLLLLDSVTRINRCQSWTQDGITCETDWAIGYCHHSCESTNSRLICTNWRIPGPLKKLDVKCTWHGWAHVGEKINQCTNIYKPKN